MDRQYLQGFDDDQLDHYLQTLKRRVSDLRELTLNLGSENQQLGVEYEALTKQKFQVYKAIQQKKKGWGKWLNKGKQKLSNIFHKGKGQQKKNGNKAQQPQALPQEMPIQAIKQQKRQQDGSIKQSPAKKLTLQNFNFDDLYHIGKQKLTGIFKKGKQGIQSKGKDNCQVQQANKQESVKENGEPINQTAKESSELQSQKAEEGISGKQLKEFAKLQAIQINGQHNDSHFQKVSEQVSKLQQLQSKTQKTQKQAIVVKEISQSNPNEVQNLQLEDEDNQFGVHFDQQMDKYQLKEQNLSQIVEKPEEKGPESQEQIEQHSVETNINQQSKT